MLRNVNMINQVTNTQKVMKCKKKNLREKWICYSAQAV